MKAIAEELQLCIDQYAGALKTMPPEAFDYRSSPAKWSRKEIIGHMIDSAQSNIRRFVMAQYEDSPHIVYDQDKWVVIMNYQHGDPKDLVDLWYLLNKQVCEILKNTPVAAAQWFCLTQEPHTLEWLAIDYIKHLRHHLNVVLDLEPVAYP